MKCFLNNQPFQIHKFSYNSGLNFGRFDGVQQIAEYRIEDCWQDVINLLKEEYTELCSDIKIDDIAENETSDFKEANYAAIEDLPNYPLQLENIFRHYLYAELLNKYISPRYSPGNYIINSIDSVMVSDDNFIIRGRAFLRIY